MWHSEKGKLRKAAKRSVVANGSGEGRKERIGEDVFSTNYSVRYCHRGYITFYICQNLQKCAVQRVNHDVICELPFIMIDQNWFLNCNKCITSMRDINDRGNWVWGTGMEGHSAIYSIFL